MKEYHPHKLTDPVAVTEFMLAGRARLTLVSTKTGKRFTYRIAKAKKPPERWFVQFLNGQSNESNYEYIGSIMPSMQYRHGLKALARIDAPVVVAFRWFLSRFKDGVMPENLEVWHEGRCGRCGRALTVPESIKRGIGPECADILHVPLKTQENLDLEEREFDAEIRRREDEEERRRQDMKFAREESLR